MAFSSPLIQKSADYVFQVFKEKLSPRYVYHNYTHTTEVVKAAELIGKGCHLGDEDMELVLLAAWFHDLGTVENYSGHEELSVKIAAEFLKNENYPDDKIEKVKGCILATRMPQHPRNLLEEVLCDADLASLGNRNYELRNGLLRLEWQKVLDKHFSDEEWNHKEVDFLMHHRYFTQFAQVEFQEQKNRNLLTLEQRIREQQNHALAGEDVRRKKEREKDKDKEKKKKKKDKASKEAGHPAAEDKTIFTEEAISKVERPSRGIETMFKITSQNHMELSAMADNKANIMISVNTIVISIVVSGLLPKLDSNPYMVIPTFVLLIVCLSAIIFATIATRPNVTGGKFTEEDVRQKKVNLLFFGNFYKMGLDEYQKGIGEMMKDKDFLYGSLTKDIYFLGLVLGRKYKYLRLSYMIFMFGLIAAVVAFVVSFAIWNYLHPDAEVPLVP